jgi:hypothetical protein
MDKIGDQLPAVAITAASLTLVFLGFLFASWDGYDEEGKSAVRNKYRVRGWLSFLGILAALASALCGFVAIGTAAPQTDHGAKLRGGIFAARTAASAACCEAWSPRRLSMGESGFVG